MMHKSCRKDRERGFAMLLVMGAVAAVFVVGLVLLSGLPAEARISRNLVNRERAVFLAESGITEALHRLENPPTPGETWAGVENRSIGGAGTYSVSITDLGDNIFQIESTGNVSINGAEAASQQIAMLVQMGGGQITNFDISDETVTVNQRFAAKTGIAGAELPGMPVTVRIRIGDESYDPFGDYTSPTGANINTDSDFEFTLPDEFEPGSTVHIEATSWDKKRSWYTGDSDNHFEARMTVSTADGSDYVKVLRNGDVLPNVDPVSGQAAIGDVVADYVDSETNTVRLASNQVIYLFELYTTDLNSQFADFQDLVLIVDFAKDVESFQNSTSTNESSSNTGGSIGMLQWSRKTVNNAVSVVTGQ